MAQPYVFFDNYAGPIYLRGYATRDTSYARKILDTTSGPVVTGDGLAMPAPLVLPVSLQAATHTALHEDLFTLISKARTATMVTYHDGTNPIADRSINGLIAWKVVRYEPPNGLFMSVNITLAPTGPYWINRSTSQPEVWEW